jgi:hypothetical protein
MTPRQLVLVSIDKVFKWNALNLVAGSFSKTLVTNRQLTWHHIQQDFNFHQQLQITNLLL